MKAGLRPERTDFRPEKADFRSERADSWPDFRPKRVNFRPERADFRSERACGGLSNQQMNRRTYRQTNKQR